MGALVQSPALLEGRANQRSLPAAQGWPPGGYRKLVHPASLPRALTRDLALISATPQLASSSLPTSGRCLSPRMSRGIIRGPGWPAAAGRGGRGASPRASLRVGITGYICKAGRAGGIRSRGRHQRHRGTLGWGRGGEHSWRPARPPYRGSARPRPGLPQAVYRSRAAVQFAGSGN